MSLEQQPFRRAKRERNFLKICHTSCLNSDPAGWRGGVNCGSSPVKYTSSHFLASVRIAVSCEICSFGNVFAKYFCPSNHRPVSPIASAASRISPNGDLYLHVYTIFIPQNFLSILPIINFALSTGYGAAIRIYCPTETTVPVVSLSPTGTRTESPTLIVKSSVL